jgi:hypothetical protein
MDLAFKRTIIFERNSRKNYSAIAECFDLSPYTKPCFRVTSILWHHCDKRSSCFLRLILTSQSVTLSSQGMLYWFWTREKLNSFLSNLSSMWWDVIRLSYHEKSYRTNLLLLLFNNWDMLRPHSYQNDIYKSMICLNRIILKVIHLSCKLSSYNKATVSAFKWMLYLDTNIIRTIHVPCAFLLHNHERISTSKRAI